MKFKKLLPMLLATLGAVAGLAYAFLPKDEKPIKAPLNNSSELIQKMNDAADGKAFTEAITGFMKEHKEEPEEALRRWWKLDS